VVPIKFCIEGLNVALIKLQTLGIGPYHVGRYSFYPSFKNIS